MVHWFSCLSLFSVGISDWKVWLSLLEARMDHDLTGFKVVNLPVFANVRWSTGVTFDLTSIHVLSDHHICVMASSCDDSTRCTDLWVRVSPNLDGCVWNARSLDEWIGHYATSRNLSL